jgi:hypothetical protein
MTNAEEITEGSDIDTKSVWESIHDNVKLQNLEEQIMV